MKSIVVVVVVLCCLLQVATSKATHRKAHVRQYHNSFLLSDGVWENITLPGSSAQFFAIGDWGGIPVFPYRTIIEEAVSSTMKDVASKYNTQFQLALGDNFYTTGVTNEYDKRFQNTFESVFTDKSLQTPWFVLMGNHDHYGNASAQIAYSKHSSRWILPDYNYSISVKVNNGDLELINIIMLDTVTLCGNTESDFVKHSQPKFTSKLEELASVVYLENLERKLRDIANSSVPYLIVAGHFPVWSIAEHGPTQCLVDKVRPLLHKYQVSAYFCGHDHNLQHIEDTYLDATVEYFVIGEGNFNSNSTEHINNIPQGSLKYHHGLGEADLMTGGFAVIQADTNSMTLTFLETGGKELYQKVIYPRRKV